MRGTRVTLHLQPFAKRIRIHIDERDDDDVRVHTPTLVTNVLLR